MAYITRFAVFVLALPSLAPAQKASAPADLRPKLAAIFQRYDHTGTPGCAVGAAIDGATVATAAYGMADLEHNIANSPDAVFEAGSVSKQFTATAVLLLAQQGKLSLDDPVRKYIPELPDYGKPLTIRHLLNHTSGLRDWGNLEGIVGWPRTTRAYTHAHVLDILSRQRALNYTPGDAYSYTNSGYNLAAILVGRVAGQPFPEFTREAIFTPRGMTSTQWRDDFRRIVRNRAIAYADTGGTVRQEMPFEDVHGNGGLLTTVGDLLRWNQNFTDFQIGGRALVDLQQQPARLNDGGPIAYAAGLMILTWKGLPEVSHSGSTAGYRAWLGRYPQQGLSVAVLCNAASANATQLGHQVADVFLANVYPPAKPTPAAAVSADALAGFAGRYLSPHDHSILTVEVRNGQLAAGTRVLKPVGANAFVNGENYRAEFIPGAVRISTENDHGVVYQRVERVETAAADLAALTGEYSSDEAELTLTIAMEGAGLVIRRRPDSKFPLTPVYRDGFSSSLGSVRFLRDAAGRVTELSIGEGRVWDLRFRRVQQATSRPPL